MLLTILLVLFLLSMVGGGLGYSRFGYASCFPLSFVVLAMVVFYFSGHLQFQ